MPFKIKDLMIDVLPEAGGGGANIACCPGTRFVTPVCCYTNPTPYSPCGPFTPCNPFTPCRIFTPCGPLTPCNPFTPCRIFTPCGPLTPCNPFTPCRPITICPGVTVIPLDQGEGIATPENLATLKAQLQQALAQIEAQEQAMEASQKPQSFEEAEALERKLLEAIEALRQHKEELQRKATGEEQ